MMLRFAETDPTSAAAPPEVPRAVDEVHDVVTAWMPWIVSFLLHLGLVILATFIIWSTVAEPEEETIIPIANLSRTPGVKLQTRPVERVQTQRTARRSVAAAAAPSFQTPAPALGLNAPMLSKASPFDAAAADAPQLSTSFLGVEGGNARQVAFVIDASGSVIDTFDTILDHLKNSINKLSEQQTFTVVFYQGDDVIEVLEPGLKRADANTRRRVVEWLSDRRNITPRGQTNPLKAIRLVVKYKPQAVFLLSDNITGSGRYEVDQYALLQEIEQAVGTIRISTIQFRYPDPLASIPGGRGTLELIAERTGGNYKFLDGAELGLR